jgi:hypothetical protein
MSLSLFETFCQIDPYVRFNDGARVTTAGQIRLMADPSDTTEYVLGTDGSGRLVVYQLSLRGYAVFPPAFVEEKSSDQPVVTDPIRKRSDFAAGFHGFL